MPKVTNEKLFEKKEYVSIINLLYNCQYVFDKDKNKISPKGLKFDQIRYALRKPEVKNKKMEDFFNNTNFLVSNKVIKNFSRSYNTRSYNSGVFRSKKLAQSQRLTEKLNFLMGKGWVSREKKGKNYRYFLTGKYFTDDKVNFFKEDITSWESKHVIDEAFLHALSNVKSRNPETFNLSEIFNFQDMLKLPDLFLLCGFSYKLILYLSRDEKKKLYSCIKSIEKNLWEILELQSKYSAIPKISFYYTAFNYGRH